MDGLYADWDPIREERLRRYREEAAAGSEEGRSVDSAHGGLLAEWPWDRQTREAAFANPGFQVLMLEARGDARARQAVETLYEWLRAHTTCPAIDPEHLQAMHRSGRRDKGRRLRDWRKGLSKSDPRKKRLFKSVPREYRNITAIVLKTVEEVETGAHAPATERQVVTAERQLAIEKAWNVLNAADPGTFSEDDLESILEAVGSRWEFDRTKEFPLELIDRREPDDVAMSGQLTEILAMHCRGESRLAHLDTEFGELEGLGVRGSRIRLKPVDFADASRYHAMIQAALSIERYLTSKDLMAGTASQA